MAMLTRYDPLREVMSLREAMDRLFQDALVAPATLRGAAGAGAPPMDVRETDDAYEVVVALSGWKPEDISVTAQENTITISGQQKEEEGDKEGQRYHVRERRVVSFTRSYSFPTPVDAEKAEARLENGELRLRLPKVESARPRQIRIGSQSEVSGERAAGSSASQPATPPGASQPASAGAGSATSSSAT